MRLKIFAALILFCFIILVFGLFYVQILKHDLYKTLSEKNRIRVLSLASPRGKIYDRRGRLLVSSRLSFDVEVIFQEIKNKENIINLLSGILKVDKAVLSKKIEMAQKRPFIPVRIREDIGKDKAIQIEELRLDMPGVIVTTKPLRNYIYKEALSHVVGYIGKISETELRKYKTYGYHMQDFVGKDGIERMYNDYLRGIDGGLQIEVDSKGEQVGVLAVKEAQSGRDAYLTIDIELQKFSHSLLADQRGTVVVMNPSTGELYALVSLPDFDPNIFIKPDNHNELSELLNNSTTFPILNRAVSGTYHPGSVFKIVVASSALDSNGKSDKKTFSCSGSFHVGNRVFHCWKEEGHGTQDIREAIKNSCNVFFYQLGLFVGADLISQYAFKFGLGKRTGIDLPGEASGLVPTPSWKRGRFNASWFKGETANYAIGQGYVVVTPIQVLCVISAVANGGKFVHPFVVERIEDVDPALQKGGIKVRYPRTQDIGLKDSTLKTLKESLRRVVNEPRGTGQYAKSENVVIAGKTGTAQNPHGQPHAWFVGFAPFENPTIAVCVFIEHGGKGGLKPASFAKKIIEEAERLGLLF